MVKTDTNKKQLLIANALKHVFRPFVKLMLANNLSYTFAIDLIKTLFVEVADQDFAIDDKRQTDSRISLMSGVHRKDVRRLRELQPNVEDVMPGNVSLGSQLIALWNANPAYTDKEGIPKPLPRFASDNADASFESMVRSLSTDIHPRAVLDEWLRLGVAKLDENNFVHLTTDMFITQEGFDEKVFYFGHNLHDHAAAAVSNVVGQRPGFFERCVHYDELSQQSVMAIADFAQKQGMKALRGVNAVADEAATSDKSANNANMRMTYGVYFYAEPMSVNPEQDSATQISKTDKNQDK
jgi:Family of unknown function (DUF6502)